MKDFNPIDPAPRDCIVCIDGPWGREDFYCVQEGNLATIILRYKARYERIAGATASKIAIYYLNSVDANHIVGIDLKGDEPSTQRAVSSASSSYERIGRDARLYIVELGIRTLPEVELRRRILSFVKDACAAEQTYLPLLVECVDLLVSLENSSATRNHDLWRLAFSERLSPVFGAESLAIAGDFLRGYLSVE